MSASPGARCGHAPRRPFTGVSGGMDLIDFIANVEFDDMVLPTD